MHQKQKNKTHTHTLKNTKKKSGKVKGGNEATETAKPRQGLDGSKKDKRGHREEKGRRKGERDRDTTKKKLKPAPNTRTHTYPHPHPHPKKN